MNYEQIKVERDGAIASLVLSRPELRNAMSERMGDEVAHAVAALNEDDELRVVLVRGEGKAFSAGGDLGFLERRIAATPEDNARRMRAFYERFLSIRKLRVPTIAVLHGPAIGAGLCFALGCDMRVAAEGAKLGLTFVRIGLTPGMGATYLLPRLVGPGVATELLLTGRVVSAEEGLRIGLVNAVCAPDELLAKARALAEETASAAPLAVRSTKLALSKWPARTLDEALDEEADSQARDYATGDLHEGVRAFRERRSPVFRGR